VRAFAAAVARLVTDEALRRRLAAGGPPRATEFDARRMVDGTERVYDWVLAARPGAR
jgi:hypothetical protein